MDIELILAVVMAVLLLIWVIVCCIGYSKSTKVYFIKTKNTYQ